MTTIGRPPGFSVEKIAGLPIDALHAMRDVRLARVRDIDAELAALAPIRRLPPPQYREYRERRKRLVEEKSRLTTEATVVKREIVRRMQVDAQRSETPYDELKRRYMALYHTHWSEHDESHRAVVWTRCEPCLAHVDDLEHGLGARDVGGQSHHSSTERRPEWS